jgi:hypothetical protein
MLTSLALGTGWLAVANLRAGNRDGALLVGTVSGILACVALGGGFLLYLGLKSLRSLPPRGPMGPIVSGPLSVRGELESQRGTGVFVYSAMGFGWLLACGGFGRLQADVLGLWAVAAPLLGFVLLGSLAIYHFRQKSRLGTGWLDLESNSLSLGESLVGRLRLPLAAAGAAELQLEVACEQSGFLWRKEWTLATAGLERGNEYLEVPLEVVLPDQIQAVPVLDVPTWRLYVRARELDYVDQFALPVIQSC